jgi:hypothetical protein
VGIKKASMTGLDLRRNSGPFTNLPTEDSKSYSNKLLQQSQKISVQAAKPKGPALKDLTPPSFTNKGDLPKLGADMSDKIANDPLVRYLKKHAEALETNGDDKVTVTLPEPLQEYPVECSTKKIDELRKARKDFLDNLFDNASQARKFGPDRV